MGRILTMSPSRWERDHIEGVIAGIRHEAATGELPTGPMWSMLERRYDIDAERFAAHHPNTAALIARSREHETNPRPDVWPIDRCSPYLPACEPRCEQPPPCGPLNPQVVPEPKSIVMASIGLGLFAVLTFFLQRTARRSVGEA